MGRRRGVPSQRRRDDRRDALGLRRLRLSAHGEKPQPARHLRRDRALPHPDALVALTSGKSEITAHFTNEPFASIEQQNPQVHQVFRSYDVFGSPHTANLITTSERFYHNNPQLVSVIIKSLNEADAWIHAHKHEAALLYLSVTNSKEPVELIEGILNNPDITYTTKPLNINYYSDFLYAVGTISSKPEKQEDLFFPKVFE